MKIKVKIKNVYGEDLLYVEDETISNAHIAEMLDLIDRKLPSELRGDYLRLQTNSSLPKGRKAIVIEAIEKIINGDYDEEG